MKRLFFALAVLISFISGSPMRAQSYGDYTFYSPQGTSKAYLVDLTGSTYHTWTFLSTARTGYSSYMLPGGVVLRTVAKSGNYFSGGPVCGEVQKVDWNGNVIWDYVYSTTAYCSHHDICPMPNGNVLLIAYELKSAAETSLAGCSQSIILWPDKIVEVQPSGSTGGTIVWEWHAWDHLSQSVNPAKNNYVTSIVQHPELFNINYKTTRDWMHVNGLDYNEKLDQITFSSHAFNEIYVIDHSTTTAQAAGHTGGNSGKGGDLLYRWGNPAAYQASGTTIFNVVHDAHWVPADCPNADYLSGFNNKGGTGGKTCIDLINPPYDGYNYSITPGAAYTPPSYNWRHTYSGTPTQDEGNAQQLPNGNTLVCISFSGYIYEINSNQTLVWSKTISGNTTNAFRYTACYVNGLASVDASASPAQICTGGTVQLNAVPAGGSSTVYTWTSNPPGFTSSLQNPMVNPSVSTTFIVQATSSTCSATDSVRVSVYSQLPAPTIRQTGDTLFSSAASRNQWFYQGAVIPDALDRFLVPGQKGEYQVQYSDLDGCFSAISASYYFAGTGSAETRLSDRLKVLPNPTTGIVRLTGSLLSGKDFEAMVCNSCGKIILRMTNAPVIDLSSFGNGIYFLSVKSKDGEIITRKIMVQK